MLGWEYALMGFMFLMSTAALIVGSLALTRANKAVTPDDLLLGATLSTNGHKGLVPAPLAGQENLFLAGNGMWSEIPKVSAT